MTLERKLMDACEAMNGVASELSYEERVPGDRQLARDLNDLRKRLKARMVAALVAAPEEVRVEPNGLRRSTP